MLIAVCSDKGSPGVTTVALALAAGWPDPAHVVEADVYGGDLAVRLRTRWGAPLPPTPTLLTLAAAARSSSDPDLVGRYAVAFTPRLRVLPAHLVAEQATGITQSWQPLAKALAASSTDVVVDLGRVHSGSPAIPVAAAADALVVVARASPESLIHLRERVTRLIPLLGEKAIDPPKVWALLVSRPRHGAGNVADLDDILSVSAAGPYVVGTGFVAHDPAAVQRLEAGEDPAGRLGRTTLLRSARSVAARIHDTATASAAPAAVSAADTTAALWASVSGGS